ncbi:hypothetical protein [Bifidobacterium sp. SO1]|uniref:hypothetical protein n=1 Tax=Bifidobacterium sp. SO1 TaxID=2809029 RepID=UPI001BDC747E|nr:hypothetical protein [Bifidobacterium sp. SO1]MBT1162135.1 hypothetical protein [Bifidobacterium sp. SO1]
MTDTINNHQNLEEFMNRCKPDTILDVFFKDHGNWVIPEALRTRPTAQQLLNNPYMCSQTIHHRDHFASIRISSGWNIYIDSPFDEKAFHDAR